MYNDTKIAVRKAFALGRMLFSLGKDKYETLFAAVSKVKPPTVSELQPYIDQGYSLEDAMIEELGNRYRSAAASAGFSEEYGTAMFKYASMEQEAES